MNIAIWGAGKFGKHVGEQIKKMQNIVCYIDNRAEIVEDVLGIKVVSPTEYMSYYAQNTDIVLIAVLNETVSIPQLSWGNNRCKWR